MTNNKQQTAVEWLAEQIRNYKTPLNMGGVYFVFIHQDMINRFEQQAKEMEKEQIEGAYSLSRCEWNKTISCSEYYNETYGGGEQ
jgi:hypothetical protein